MYSFFCVHFSRLSIWYCLSSWCTQYWKLLLPLPVLVSCLCFFFHWVEASWAFPLLFSMSLAVTLLQLQYRQSCWWEFMCVAFSIIRKYNLKNKFFILWALTIFLPPLHILPWALGAGIFLQIYVLKLSFKILYFDLLWFSVFTFLFLKEHFFFDEWWRL